MNFKYIRRNGSIVNNAGNLQFITKDKDDSVDDDNCYGIAKFIGRVKELNLVGLRPGHELDKYDMLMNGHTQDDVPRMESVFI